MIKVLIFSKTALENGRGGEISYIELAVGLKKYFNVSIMDTNVLFSKAFLTEEVIHKKLKGVKQIGRFNFATLKILNKVITIPYPWEIIKLYKTIKGYDIIYTSVGNIKINILLIFFGLINRRIKFVIRYNKPLSSENFFSLYNIKINLSILLFSIFKRNFYHHTISKHAKKYLDNFYNPNNVIHIIHGVELKDYQQSETYEKSRDVLKFIYVGHLDDVHKGLGVLINAIRTILEKKSKLPIFFEFCGRGPLEQKISELEAKYPKYVKFHGYVDNDIVHEYYKKSDIFLFTSRREPFGRVLIEALAAKLLIICTKTFGSIEILKGKEFAFFLNKLNTSEIENTIHKVHELWKRNPQKFNKLKESAKRHAIEKYDYSYELKGFIKLINSIIKRC